MVTREVHGPALAQPVGPFSAVPQALAVFRALSGHHRPARMVERGSSGGSSWGVGMSGDEGHKLAEASRRWRESEGGETRRDKSI